MGRNRILLIVAVLGVITGFAAVRLWNAGEVPAAAGGENAVPMAAEPDAEPTAAGSSLSVLEPPRGRGSSMSVVGSMSREEMDPPGCHRLLPSLETPAIS